MVPASIRGVPAMNMNLKPVQRFRLLLFCPLLLLPPQTLADQPNILLLMAEDMSPRAGASGDAVAVTPNTDQLAREGVRYTRVFTTAGVCAPSRAAMVLGMHQVATGTQHMRTSSRPEGGYLAVPPPDVKAYPELLRRAGYYTYTDTRLDYQFSRAFAGSGPFSIWDAENATTGGWRGRDPGEPFFGQRNFLVSHESGVFRQLGSWPNNRRHFMTQLYRWQNFGWVDDVVDPADVPLPPYYPDTPTARTDVARHYNNIAAMDREVGEILQALEADGLKDSTIVIWTSDHGDGLPRAKRELHDSGIHVPMIVRWPERYRPRGVQPGSVDDRLVSAVDFAPTILGFAGVEPPEYLQGESFVASDRQYVFASRDRIDAIADRQRAVRDERYKYIRSWYPAQEEGHPLAYRDDIDMVQEMRAMFEAGELDADQRRWFEPVGEERLYDLESDPHELRNLAADPAHAGTLSRLRTALEMWMANIGDLGDVPESELVDRFGTYPVVPGTPGPVATIEDCTLTIASDNPGSSIGYRREGEERWRLYTGPLDHCESPVAEIRAVRYGWQASPAEVLPVGGS